MKKVILAAVALTACASAFGAGTNVCTGGTAAGTVAVSAQGTPKFIKRGFNQQCSANVNLAYDENDVGAVVGANSKKGKTNFGGSTDGGAVTKITGSTDCTSGCSQAPQTLPSLPS